MMIKKLMESIAETICYDKSIIYPKACSDFIALQVKNSPFHIKLGLIVVAILFFLLSVFYGLGRPFFCYNSKYQQISFIMFFERICKTSRMFISFIRSMSLIYICDNNLL